MSTNTPLDRYVFEEVAAYGSPYFHGKKVGLLRRKLMDFAHSEEIAPYKFGYHIARPCLDNILVKLGNVVDRYADCKNDVQVLSDIAVIFDYAKNTLFNKVATEAQQKIRSFFVEFGQNFYSQFDPEAMPALVQNDINAQVQAVKPYPKIGLRGLFSEQPSQIPAYVSPWTVQPNEPGQKNAPSVFSSAGVAPTANKIDESPVPSQPIQRPGFLRRALSGLRQWWHKMLGGRISSTSVEQYT